MKYILKFLMFSLVLSTIISTSGCGRVSKNEPIKNSGYPHSYPRL